MTTLTITGQQIKFLDSLMEQREGGKEYVLGKIKDQTIDSLDRKAASELISTLLTYKKVKQAAKSMISAVGIYNGADGNVYRVQESKYNPGKFYAKRLIVSAKGQARFEYDPSGMKQITPESKMSLDQAEKFGIQYGVCCRCSRDLTNAVSVSLGIGPVCRKAFL